MSITENVIYAEVERLHKLVSESVTHWKTAFTHVSIEPLSRSKAKTTFGLARPCGHISLTSKYIGTDYIEALRETILHEFTHLIVGLDIAHGSKFKRVHSFLCMVAQVDFEKARVQKRNICDAAPKAPLTLIAFMTNGEQVVIGDYLKKSKKYEQYNPDEKPLSLKGHGRIARFEYLQNAG